MALVKTSELTLDASPALTDRVVVVTDPSTTPVSGLVTLTSVKTLFGIDTKTWEGSMSNPQAMYAQRAQVVIGLTTAAITITSIKVRINDSTPTAELAGDLKFADDQFTGSFANATVIDICDTISGAFTATSSFDDATVPSGKFVYFQFDASPHVDIVDVFIQILYTVD